MQACHRKAHNTFTNFLPKRPYLVRQRHKYVSGTSSSGTTSARPFPSDQLSSECKDGVGNHLLQPSLQESKSQGLGISLPHQDVCVRSFYFSVYIVLCIKDLLRLSLISFQGCKNYEIPKPTELVFIVD